MRVNDVQYEKGDTIALIGTFSSSSKTAKNDSGRIVYFENVIVDDMAVVKRKKHVQDGSLAGGFGDFGGKDGTEEATDVKQE